MELKERLKELRREKTVSAGELAALTGKAESTVRTWETGKSYPDADTLSKLSNFFGVSVDYLLGISPLRIHDVGIEGAAELTGLSIDTISMLCELKKNPDTGKLLEVLELLIKHETPPPKPEDYHFVGTFGEPIEFSQRNFEMAHDYWSDNHACLLTRLAKRLSYSTDPDIERAFIECQKALYEKGLGGFDDEKNIVLSSYKEALTRTVTGALEKFIAIEDGD